MTPIRKSIGIHFTLILALSASMAGAQSHGPKFGELLKRVPDQANVLALIDVDALLNSKIGIREGWRKKLENREESGLGFSYDIQRLVVATSCDLPTLEDRWKLGLGEARGNVPDLKAIAAHEGGYVEDVRGVPVAWTPRGFFLFRFAPRTVGFAGQVDRQVLSRWIGDTLSRPRTYPPGFADRAFFRAEAGTPVVLAVNLDAIFSPRLVEPWLKGQPAVQKAKLEVSSLANRLADVESAFLQIDAADGLQATLHADFRSEVDVAAPVFKDLLLALLDERGVALPEMGTWRQSISADKKSYELVGRIGVESLKKVLTFAQPPRMVTSLGPDRTIAPPGQASAAATSPSDVVKASQQYFRSVVDKLDGLKQEKSGSYGRSKVWYERYAKQIEELPILGVDGDLLDWGDLIARTLREMAFGINYSVRDQNYRMAQHPNGAYGGYDGYVIASNKSYDAAALKRASDSVLSVDLDGRWQRIEHSIAETRRKMVTKYKVDF